MARIAASGSSCSTIQVTFDHTDFVAGEKVIGNIPVNGRIHATQLIVSHVFDGGSVNVGDDIIQGHLLSAAENDLTLVETYEVGRGTLFTAQTTAKMYFNGAPTKGDGSVIVYIG
jgi:hypothetical protein